MSLLEAQNLASVNDWTPAMFVECIEQDTSVRDTTEKTKNGVSLLLETDGNLPFGFEELIQHVVDSMTINDNQERILRIIASLFMRLHIEKIKKLGKKRLPLDQDETHILHRDYSVALGKLGVEKPRLETTPATKAIKTPTSRWSFRKLFSSGEKVA